MEYHTQYTPQYNTHHHINTTDTTSLEPLSQTCFWKNTNLSSLRVTGDKQKVPFVSTTLRTNHTQPHQSYRKPLGCFISNLSSTRKGLAEPGLGQEQEAAHEAGESKLRTLQDRWWGDSENRTALFIRAQCFLTSPKDFRLGIHRKNTEGQYSEVKRHICEERRVCAL